MLTQKIKDAVNPGILDTNGTPVGTPHLMYVDDAMYLDIANATHFKHATAASIKAIFILPGESDLTRQQDPIFWDKLLDMMIAPVNCILGLTINSCRLTVDIPPDFLAKVITILCTSWGLHQQTVIINQASSTTLGLVHPG